MTAISSSVSMGRQMLDNRISKAASTGSISSTDQTALETALDNIDSTFSPSAVGGSSPTDIKSKMDTLIQQQVSSGVLTSDQASELQGMFAQGSQAPQGQPNVLSTSNDDATMSVDASQNAAPASHGHGVHGHHHHGGGGALAFLDSTNDTTSTTDLDGTSSSTDVGTGTATSTSINSTAGSSSVDANQLDTLMTFLQNLQSSMSSSTYGTTTASNSSGSSGILVNTLA